MSVAKIIARGVEALLARWFFKGAAGLYHAGKQNAAVNDVILAVAMVATIESLMWLWSQRSKKNRTAVNRACCGEAGEPAS